MRGLLEKRSKSRTIAECFLRLSDLDPTLLDRVGRYEARRWRQAAQTIWTLDAMRRPELAPMRWAIRKPRKGFYWHAETSFKGFKCRRLCTQREVIIPWVANQKFIVKQGMTGATGNIHVGLHEFTDMMFVHVIADTKIPRTLSMLYYYGCIAENVSTVAVRYA
jgi:hypothetical protein